MKPNQQFFKYVAAGMLAASTGTAHADCWQDAHLSRLAASVAAERFPDVFHSMPQVLVCHDQHFAPNIGATYTGGEHIVRIPRRTLGQNPWMVVAHELGHAANAIRGSDDGSLNGHDEGWMRVMVNAGLRDEAERVARQYPGGLQALAAAAGGTSVPPVALAPQPVAPVAPAPPQFIPPTVVYLLPQVIQVVTPAFYPPGISVWVRRGYGGWR